MKEWSKLKGDGGFLVVTPTLSSMVPTKAGLCLANQKLALELIMSMMATDLPSRKRFELLDATPVWYGHKRQAACIPRH